MNQNIEFQQKVLMQKIRQQMMLYTTAIREGRFADAKGVEDKITGLQLELDKLLPFKRS
jgi:hypothetical protein